MENLTKQERITWIATNVPLMLRQKFINRLNEVRDDRDAFNTKILKRILSLVKKNEIESDFHAKQMMRYEHDKKDTTFKR